jgi:predicted HTH domain antitoxin
MHTPEKSATPQQDIALRIEIELPRDLLIALNVPVEHIGSKVKEWIVLELFRDGKISAGKSATVLGIPKGQFINLLSQYRIPYLDWDADELAQEMWVATTAMSHKA